MAFDWTLNRTGTDTGAAAGVGAQYELPEGANVERFKILYGPEVLANFKKNLVFGKATKVKGIEKGKGYEFNLLAEVEANYVYPGEQLTGQTIARGTKQVFLDGILASSVAVHELDELLNHTDERTRYAESMGYKLAVKYDKALAAEVIRASMVKPISGIDASVAKGGNVVERKITGASDEALELFQAILDLGLAFDEKDVPKSQRTLVLKPKYYWLLLQNIDLINSMHPGIGNIATGDVLKIAGFTIVMSNNIPSNATEVEKHEIQSVYQADGTTASSFNNIPTYGSIGGTNFSYKSFNKETDVSKVIGLAFVPNALVTLKRKGLTIDTQWKLDYLSTIIVARMVVGHGWLNPAGCGILIDNDPSSSVIVE